MIIWRGLGILVPIIAGLVFVGVLKLVDSLIGTGDYSKWNYWPKALAALLAGAAIWFLGRYLNTRPGKVVIDKSTGQEMELRSKNDLFFVPFEYWGIIIGAFAVVGYFV